MTEQVAALISAAQVDIHAAVNGGDRELVAHLNDAVENLNRAIDLHEEQSQ